MQWRLISQLSLNYLSLVSEGKEALQEICASTNFSTLRIWRNKSLGLHASGADALSRVISQNTGSVSCVEQVELELDEEQFVGGGAYLFSSVLEIF